MTNDKYRLTYEQEIFYRENLKLITWFINNENRKKSDSNKIVYEDAYSLLSDTLIRSIKRFDETKGSFSTFFCSNARKDMTKYYRKRRNTNYYSPMSAEYEAEILNRGSGDIELLLIEIKECLDPEEIQILNSLINGETSREIASNLNISKTKTLNKIKQLREKVREIMLDGGDSYV